MVSLFWNHLQIRPQCHRIRSFKSIHQDPECAKIRLRNCAGVLLIWVLKLWVCPLLN
jgi:hypothetical protein